MASSPELDDEVMISTLRASFLIYFSSIFTVRAQKASGLSSGGPAQLCTLSVLGNYSKKNSKMMYFQNNYRGLNYERV